MSCSHLRRRTLPHSRPTSPAKALVAQTPTSSPCNGIRTGEVFFVVQCPCQPQTPHRSDTEDVHYLLAGGSTDGLSQVRNLSCMFMMSTMDIAWLGSPCTLLRGHFGQYNQYVSYRLSIHLVLDIPSHDPMDCFHIVRRKLYECLSGTRYFHVG